MKKQFNNRIMVNGRESYKGSNRKSRNNKHAVFQGVKSAKRRRSSKRLSLQKINKLADVTNNIDRGVNRQQAVVDNCVLRYQLKHAKLDKSVIVIDEDDDIITIDDTFSDLNKVLTTTNNNMHTNINNIKSVNGYGFGETVIDTNNEPGLVGHNRKKMKQHSNNSVIVIPDDDLCSNGKSKKSQSRNSRKRKSNSVFKDGTTVKGRRRSKRISLQNGKKLADVANNTYDAGNGQYALQDKVELRHQHKKAKLDMPLTVIDEEDDAIIIIDDTPCSLNKVTTNNNTLSNIYNAKPVRRKGLREIVIDGTNIALGYTNGVKFSIEGLKKAIDYFLKRKHKVKAFVPQFRLKFKHSTNQKLLNALVKQNLVITTPSRLVKGQLIASNDCRYIIQYATLCEGVVVSNSDFKDVVNENPEWGETVRTRLLKPTWRDNKLEFPNKPLGRNGPNLNNFLKF